MVFRLKYIEMVELYCSTSDCYNTAIARVSCGGESWSLPSGSFRALIGVKQDVGVLNLVGRRLSFFTIAWSSERSSLVNSTIYFFFMVGLLAKKGKGY